MTNLRLRGFRIRRFFSTMLLLLLASGAVFLWSLRARPAQGDQPPPGYQSRRLVELAIFTGQLALVNVKPPLPESVELVEGIEYGRAGDVSLQLDLYTPKNIEHPTAGLILIHGGSWKSGRREDYRYYGIKFAEQGYVVASISYRLLQVAPFPAAVEDTKCAVRWLRAHAEQHHVDPSRIAVFGGSAGGHLAMMVGYSSDVPELEGDGGNNEVSSRVQAVVDLYGPVDLTTEYARKKSKIAKFIGKPYDEATQVYKLASPITHITQDDPPTLILHGTIDELVPIRQADLLDEALKKAGVSHQYYRLEGWPHAMDISQVVNDYCVERMLQFFETYLAQPDAATASP